MRHEGGASEEGAGQGWSRGWSTQREKQKSVPVCMYKSQHNVKHLPCIDLRVCILLMTDVQVAISVFIAAHGLLTLFICTKRGGKQISLRIRGQS